MRVLNTRANGERGAALLESAMTMLTLLIFILGIWEASRLLSFRETMANAAREGARYAVLPLPGTDTLPNDSDIQAVVNRYLDAAGVRGATTSVTASTVTISGIDTTFKTVQVDAPYKIITISIFRNLEVTLRGSSRMRNETSG
jgi:Flp pilus assembly protein TadG